MNAPRESPLKGARVLIVEDEFFLADDLARGLRAAGGEPVGPVSTVEQAEELVSGGQLDGAIVDLNLHGEMASEFVERLAAVDLPCLIVSGYGDDAVPESVSGVRRLEKPVSPGEVLQCLAGEIARAS
jgi:DNA-binding NtrC family response regulator